MHTHPPPPPPRAPTPYPRLSLSYPLTITYSLISTSPSLLHAPPFLPPCRHSAGDVLMLQPQNISSAVTEFMDLMQLDPEQKFTLEQNDAGIYVAYVASLLTKKIQSRTRTCHQ